VNRYFSATSANWWN